MSTVSHSPEDIARWASSVPPAVAAQARAAEEALQQSIAPPEAPSDEPLPPLPNGDPIGQVAPESNGEAPASPQLPLPGIQPPSQQQPDDNWEQRYKSAQGRVTSLTDAVKNMGDRINQLEGILSTVQATRATPAPSEPPEPYKPQVTPEEEETYGKELLEVVAKRARDALAPKLQELEQRFFQLNNQVGNVGQSIAASSKERFEGELTANLPDWRAQNRDQGFLDWLKQIDPYSGKQRKTMLKEAAGLHDTARVLSFFQGYRSEVQATADPQSAPPNQGPTTTVVPKVPLQALAAPGRQTSAAPSNGPAQKPVYTTSDIARAYLNKRNGKYRGREAEFDAWERDMFIAQHEGRIINR